MEKERRIKVLSVAALIVAVLGLTIAFAALSQTLTINGKASMGASQWNVHFENLSNASITGEAKELSTPQITDGGITINNMNVSLSKPKDKVEYTVEIVNSGSITAKIEKIQMTELTQEQSKYLEFYANYSDGRSVSESDILAPKQRETVKIVIGFKEDLTKENLPKEVTTIDLSLTIDYVQSDDEGNNGEAPSEPSVDVDSLTLGNEVCLGKECFYVMSTTDNTVTMLSKYNLNVGDNKYLNTEEGIQNENVKGFISGDMGTHNQISYGTVEFSQTGYWVDVNNTNHVKVEYGTSVPAFVYDTNSSIYKYVQNYQNYLRNELGKKSVTATLMSYEQATSLGCDANTASCENAPSWVYGTSYWLGSAGDAYNQAFFTWYIGYSNSFGIVWYNDNSGYGIRPVVTIDKSEL